MFKFWFINFRTVEFQIVFLMKDLLCIDCNVFLRTGEIPYITFCFGKSVCCETKLGEAWVELWKGACMPLGFMKEDR
jgi:hypothetical protein